MLTLNSINTDVGNQFIAAGFTVVIENSFFSLVKT